MSNEILSPEEVAVAIRARRILKKAGLAPNADVTTICKHSRISRKTGYKWADKFSGASEGTEKRSTLELEQLRAEHARLEKAFDDLRFEHEGLKIAWEIHGVDEMMAVKGRMKDGG